MSESVKSNYEKTIIKNKNLRKLGTKIEKIRE
jgi:hypothetical protein